MKDLAQIMQQAQAMQAKMAEVQQKIENTEADGVAGAGLVRVKLRGKGEMVSVTIDRSLMGDDPEIVEDLIKAAHSDARKRLDQAMEEAMKSATAGFGGLLPGFKLPF
ncbi:MAG: YbaB/EbfC family nucleoid-associated protein [Hyphomonas sp.]|uniref:YbaB/EbfC family nucleoid-associated protein n=1 Tax=Hyphomonas sp. TaxID=87 RepID=UPI001DC2271F|nr:YbaB/EbfC family nucleoid-associated protein [Hyphomonas sp.]MBA4225921.1 YbaB/EbfC family nucleoid-associated protein [Hyphomonas sp.]